MTIKAALGILNALNDASPGQLADLFRALRLGNFIRSARGALRGYVPAAPAANPYVAAASLSITLPDDAKAAILLRGYMRTGTAGVGELTVDVAQTGTATDPGSGHVGISPSCDLVFHGADVPTLVDIDYIPAKYDVMEFTLPFATSSVTIPSLTPSTNQQVNAGGPPGGKVLAMYLLEAEVITGTVPGKVIVDGPGTATASGHADLDAPKTHVIFNVAQAGAAGTARVKLGVYSVPDLDQLLEVAPALGAGVYF